jgi:hypothetical protein
MGGRHGRRWHTGPAAASGARETVMVSSLNPEPAYERVSFVKPCVYCGARFAVFVSREVGSGEEHSYHCPECGKDYLVHAALEPLVNLLESRTDGKQDRYQETMF